MKLHFTASNSPRAQNDLEEQIRKYGQADIEDCDVIVALGGDGFMLETLNKTRDRDQPVYGLNRGTVGFLMNHENPVSLLDRIQNAKQQVIRPLIVHAEGENGEVHVSYAINDISALRMTSQAANIEIKVDEEIRIQNLMCDGVILSTPAGSTAYNYSANGPILPIGSNVLALTPIAAFRPRRWRGAIIPHDSVVSFTNHDSKKRPIMINADSKTFKNIKHAMISVSSLITHRLLFDPQHGLEDRIIAEQFE